MHGLKYTLKYQMEIRLSVLQHTDASQNNTAVLGDTLHTNKRNTRYSLKISSNNFNCNLYFNIYFKPNTLKLNILYPCIAL
jgi:hypothetical protein